MTRKYVVETVIGRVYDDYKYFRRTVELAVPEDADAPLAVGDKVLVTNAAYSVPALCEVITVTPDRVRLKRVDDQNPYTLLLSLPMK
jgi:hypothetical protein